MERILRVVALLAVSATLTWGCGDDSPDPGGMPMGTLAPGFALVDLNPNSASHDSTLSPRDYLEKVSAWYFGHST